MRRGSDQYCQTQVRSSRPSVAVIIIGYNGEEFLPACLDSVISQAHSPDEIVYVDDASSDDSVRVARRWGKGVKVIEKEVNGGMCAARMTGVEATSSTLLLFVDCDNTLPPDYLMTMLEDIGYHDFVYPSKRFFGIGIQERIAGHHPTGVWVPQESCRADLWQANYADTCSLMKRSAFLAAGGWVKRKMDTLGDWDLFLRMSRTGTHARSRAMLNYRLHSGNNSFLLKFISNEERYGMARLSAASLSVALIYSGRLPGLMRMWLNALTATLAADGRTAELIVVDASPDGIQPIERSDVITGIQIIRVAGVDAVARRKNRNETAEFLAGAFNAALDRMSGDILWCVEDDTIVPINACHDMITQLLGQQNVVTAVGGCYRSRHQTEDWVVGSFDGHRVNHLQRLPSHPFPTQLTGTGCLMILKDRLRGIRFQGEWNHGGKRSPAHDWTMSWALYLRGDAVVMMPSVICRHYDTEDAWV